MRSKPKCSILFVTHNAQKFMDRCFRSIDAQSTRPASITIVDSGSADPSYLSPYGQREDVRFVQVKHNLGVCKGTNLGYELLPADTSYVLLINPDTFLKPDVIEEGMAYLEQPRNEKIAAVTGTLLGFDIDRGVPSDSYDATGVFRSWYGRWYDRDQGITYDALHRQQEERLPAMCGALMLCRKSSLDSVLLRERELFDEYLGTQKEDIELSLRLRKNGWQLAYLPQIQAYHCRGWSQSRPRHTVSRPTRLLAARNDCLLDIRYRSAYIAASSAKYMLVKLLNI